MKKNEKTQRIIYRSLFSFRNYLIFFLIIAFAVTASFLIFLDSMNLNEALIREAAVKTFLNILLLSLLYTLIDRFRRKLTVERPVKRILEATRRLTEGDFTARIQPLHVAGRFNELDIIIENFNKMAEELSGVETLRIDFVSSVSHELKTPLAVIQNYSALLQISDLSEEKRIEYACAIAENARSLAELTSNILKLNRLENQQIFPEKKTYDLGEQLCECLLAFENEWESKALIIDTDFEDAVTVCEDRELLNLVWKNLISNAIKFTEPGGRLSVRLQTSEENATVSVSDTGCGISPETGAHIFEKFYQGDTSHAAKGNGLGLALVRRVIDIIGADISVESKLGEGSTFIVRLRKYSYENN